MDDRISGATLDDGDGGGMADQWIDVSIFRRSFATENIGVDEHDFVNGRLFQKLEGLYQSSNKASTGLVYIQTQHVLLQAKPALDDVAGRRHKIVGRDGHQEERINFVGLEKGAVKEIFQAEDGEVRNAHARLNQAAFVIAHDLL